MRARVTIKGLALEAEADVDEVLVTLWDQGLEGYDSPDDLVDSRHLSSARQALGITAPREQRKIQYWMTRTNSTRVELAVTLADLGVSLPTQARVLPKGALRKLRRLYEDSPAAVSVEEKTQDAPCPPFNWDHVGATRDMLYVTEEEVLEIHDALVRDFAAADDPIEPPGVRSRDLLASALYRPMTSLGGDAKYPTVEMAGAALLHSLVLNHPFHNGNKRTGLVSLLVFLDRNGVMPTCEEKDLFRFVLRVAQHGFVSLRCDHRSDREVLEMSRWIRRNSRPIEKGERPIPWHRLRRILRNFDCETEASPGVGNRINISRVVIQKGVLGRVRRQVLATQVHYGDEGREVERNALHKIRTDLHLDERHGCDSKAFYEAEALPDDFIQQYRTLLRRLARL